MFFLGLTHLEGSPKDNLNIQSSGLRTYVSVDLSTHITVQLNCSLKPIKGYDYGIIGIPVIFYAHVFNGSGMYEFHWFVNSNLVKNASGSSSLSNLTWTFTNTSHFDGGYYNYVNVTVTDSLTYAIICNYRNIIHTYLIKIIWDRYWETFPPACCCFIVYFVGIHKNR